MPSVPLGTAPPCLLWPRSTGRESLTSHVCAHEGTEVSRAEADWRKVLAASGPGGRGRPRGAGSQGVSLDFPCALRGAALPSRQEAGSKRKQFRQKVPTWRLLCESRRVLPT